MVDWSKVSGMATHYGTILNMTGFWHINGDDVKFSSEGKGWVELKFQGDRTKLLEGLTPRPDDGIAQSHSPANKYDRTITGKYGTGQCTVDVYRVLSAFGPLSPEIDHAVKKLLAPGSRGHKDEKQDLLEAIQSIEARLQYLEAVNA